jgi:hypothetical protein
VVFSVWDFVGPVLSVNQLKMTTPGSSLPAIEGLLLITLSTHPLLARDKVTEAPRQEWSGTFAPMMVSLLYSGRCEPFVD